MNISLVIPNYNGERLLRKNLQAYLKVQGATEVVIIDDCSTDGSVSYINEQIRKNANREKLRLVTSPKHLGFSSAVNKGVRESRSQIVVLLNTDVAPEENFLSTITFHFRDPQVFAVGCLDKSIEGKKIIMRGRGLGRWQRGFLVHRRGEVDKTDTLWVSCGSGAFRKDIWEKLGGLDPMYNPFYWEDIDLSYMAKKAGYKVLFEPKSVVIHRHEEGVIRKNYSRFQVNTIAYRNQCLFVWKNINDPGLLLSHLFWLPYHVLKGIATFDPAFLKGLLMALLKFPHVLKSRQESKKNSLRRDREVLSSFK